MNGTHSTRFESVCNDQPKKDNYKYKELTRLKNTHIYYSTGRMGMRIKLLFILLTHIAAFKLSIIGHHRLAYDISQASCARGWSTNHVGAAEPLQCDCDALIVVQDAGLGPPPLELCTIRHTTPLIIAPVAELPSHRTAHVDACSRHTLRRYLREFRIAHILAPVVYTFVSPNYIEMLLNVCNPSPSDRPSSSPDSE
jgi:hypothetical protein